MYTDKICKMENCSWQDMQYEQTVAVLSLYQLTALRVIKMMLNLCNLLFGVCVAALSVDMTCCYIAELPVLTVRLAACSSPAFI